MRLRYLIETKTDMYVGYDVMTVDGSGFIDLCRKFSTLSAVVGLFLRRRTDLEDFIASPGQMGELECSIER